MSGKLEVTTEKLKQKQEKWLEILRQIEVDFRETGEMLNRLEQSFMGKPVEIIKGKGIKKQEEGMADLKRLKLHIGKLEEIGELYEQAERSNANVTADH